MTEEQEQPLAGGGMAPVVRAGRTVRRRAGPWTPAVHALLRYLEEAGFDATPRALGVDDQGREVLSYVEGADGHRLGRTHAEVHGDDALAAVAHLIRRYHDLAAGFVPPARARWQFMAGAPREGIVCHNDLGPVNTIYREGRPVALIDWDFAAPCPPAWDLAYAAWRYVPLYPDEDCERMGYPILPRGPRLRLFLDAYGLEERAGFLELIRARQQSLYDTVRLGAEAGDEEYARIWAETRGEQWRRSMRYLDMQGTEWERAIAH